MHHPRWQKFNIENPINMGSYDERCIFMDVQCNEHVYKISDTMISWRFFMQVRKSLQAIDLIRPNDHKLRKFLSQNFKLV